jgi:hypothetical protein
MYLALQRSAQRHAGVEEGIACAGTAVESRTFKVNSRAFLFLRPQDARLKLADSLPEAVALAATSPDVCRAGSGGWVHVNFSPGDLLPPIAMLERWIAESYRLMGGGDPQRKSTPRKKAPTKLAKKRARPKSR